MSSEMMVVPGCACKERAKIRNAVENYGNYTIILTRHLLQRPDLERGKTILAKENWVANIRCILAIPDWPSPSALG
jgi:hypothetical protein